MTETEKAKYLPQIAATLKYGRYWETKRKRYIILFAVFTAFMIAFSAIPIYYLGIEQAEPFDNTFQLILALIGIILAFISPSVICLVVIVRNERTRKEILLWLDDAIETGAYSHLFGTSSISNGKWGSTPTYKIKIKFKIDGKHISCFSKGKNKGFWPFWKKYADKEVKILYSPKYEEVMILK